MLTLKGRALLLDNLRNKITGENTNKISFMGIGEGNSIPSQFDKKLDHEIIKSKTSLEVDLAESCILAKAEFDTNKFDANVSEIGLFTEDGMLVARDLVESSSIIKGGIMEVVYKLLLSHDVCVSEWEHHTTNVHVSPVLDIIYGVYEDNGNGYVKLNSINEVENTPSSYYHDRTDGKLYIHNSKDYRKEVDNIYVRIDEIHHLKWMPSVRDETIISLPDKIKNSENTTDKYSEKVSIQEWLNKCPSGALALKVDEITEDKDILTVRRECTLFGDGSSGRTVLNIKGINIPQAKQQSLRLQNIKIGEHYFKDTVFVNEGVHDILIIPNKAKEGE